MPASFFHPGRIRVPALLLVAALCVPVAEAQKRRQPIIRDTEIEAILRSYAEPLFRAAGIGSRGADIILVQDSDFNAFVASGNRMVIHTGTLMTAKTPNEVIGVLAHETGHLAGGHVENLRNEIARSQAIGAIVGMLGMAGMAAGAMAGSQAGAQAGQVATMMGPNVAMRTLLSYKRAQELAADRAALTYLTATSQSAKGMIAIFQTFADQQLFSAQYADPYAQSHPMARDRLDQLETAARKSPYWEAVDSPELQLKHDMMRAKLSGFIDAPGTVERRFPRADKSLPAQYARAIAAYRTGSTRSAIRAVDELIAQAPGYPYFHELKGQILLESGKAREAIGPLGQAVALAPQAGLIRILYGHALLQTGEDALLGEAVAQLRAGLETEPLASIGYRHLASALQRQGKIAEAELATAQGMLIDGDIASAKNFAQRAQAKLGRGSPGWLRADDILATTLPSASTN